ncbi:ATP-binding cassette domain-containing protein [Kitasatospora sp. RB6PN24]|uniref:ABC transporter ATP-binding protein n=1 Tax=Kitasatospora humi TaxID=2893891 RepID=UPI001E46E029|nr:ATP-binding cassette domain-containing protein [Kitasatospora humi]MCC9306824.1 ATP-binding cassette domain-containing protein [Kitasatospora humi]
MRLAGVGKRYRRGGPWVLRDLELTLPAGALVRIEGANGSGKSTLLKLVGGIEPPSRGRIETSGRRAYVPERFPPALPFDAGDYLCRLGRIHGLSARTAAERTAYWLERFGIADRAGTPLNRLSKGTCQKVAVAQALLAEADVLLLDEAWTGLDQAARAVLDEAAAERAGQGGTVLFVDHDPPPSSGPGYPHRLAGLTTAAYLVQDGRVTAREVPAASAPGPGAPPGEDRGRMQLLVAATAELPELLPGTPERRPQPDGTVRLLVAAEHSDALLRRLLGGSAPAHILEVTRVAAQSGPEAKPLVARASSETRTVAERASAEPRTAAERG